MIKRIVAWAIDRSAAMNTLMIAIILAGIFSFGVMRRESFPEFELEIILVTVPYPGAAPAVTEEGICQKLESAIHPIAGIKKLTSVAAEGVGYAVVEIYPGEDAQKILNEIRGAVDRIPSLPQLAENKDVRQVTMRNPAIRVGVLGPKGSVSKEAEMKKSARNCWSKSRFASLESRGCSSFLRPIQNNRSSLRLILSVQNRFRLMWKYENRT